jgi:hypothetical protein
MNPGIKAARRLSHLGYRFTVNGDTIKARYEAPGEPDPSQVKPPAGPGEGAQGGGVGLSESKAHSPGP